jgi:exonuclease III
MNSYTKWTITQYNVNKSKDKVQHHFLQELDPKIHQVVAVQEPWLNPRQLTTVKHPAYHLIFPPFQGSRTCIYVSKALNITQWRKEDTPEGAAGDITSISLQTAQGRIWIHNVYNPPPESHSSSNLQTLQWLPELLEAQG